MSENHPPPIADEEISEKEFDEEMEGCFVENVESYTVAHEEQSEGSLQVSNSTTQTEACKDCENHKKTIHRLKNQVIGLRTCLRNQRNLAWMYRKRKY